jgi:hypothetical protein
LIKPFLFGSSISIYIWVINAPNTKLVDDVWREAVTGNPGYLSTQQGIDEANSYDTDADPTTSGEEYRDFII